MDNSEMAEESGGTREVGFPCIQGALIQCTYHHLGAWV